MLQPPRRMIILTKEFKIYTRRQNSLQLIALVATSKIMFKHKSINALWKEVITLYNSRCRYFSSHRVILNCHLLEKCAFGTRECTYVRCSQLITNFLCKEIMCAQKTEHLHVLSPEASAMLQEHSISTQQRSVRKLKRLSVSPTCPWTVSMN